MAGLARIPLIAILFAGACVPVRRPETAPTAVVDSAVAPKAVAMETPERDSGPASSPPNAGSAPREPATTPTRTSRTPPRTSSAPSGTASPAPPPAIKLPEAAAPLTLESGGSLTNSLNGEAPAWLPAEVSWDIEVKEYLSHDRVDFYVRRFTGPARPTVVSWMQRGLRYEPMIRKTFREHGIAEDMYYLGLVESGYDPHAYSRAAAVGMWQFMTSTARGVGLRVDWWVDERRDPMKSTQAAARFLSSLRDQFGSMYLAAAAYNGGPGRVSRGLTRYADNVAASEGDDQFFALAETRALHRETSNYVPQLIAAAAIGKQPWKYGIRLDPVAPYAYDSLLVPPATAVAALTLVTGAPLDSLREHNPHLLRGATPPDGETWVRVPTGFAPATFSTDFLGLPDSVRAAWRTVKVKKATTLASMAKGYGITATQLRWYNPKLTGTRIAAGKTINVPSKLAISGAFAVADPSVERYGAAVNGVHIVRKGETLSHIASRNNTTVTRLMAINGLKKDVIFPGQAIRVRAAAPKKTS